MSAPLVSSLASLAAGQTTSIATLLLPNVCLSQAAPNVSVLGQSNGLTTYTYNCDNYVYHSYPPVTKSSRAVSTSAPSTTGDAKTSSDIPSGISKVKRMNPIDCGGSGPDEACLPWQITQGASYWAVHLTLIDKRSDSYSIAEECTFGDGGVANGPATCTFTQTLLPIFNNVSSSDNTATLAKSIIDNYYFRDTVTVTGPAATSTAKSTGLAAARSVPTGVAAIVAGAGGILAAALAL